MSAFEPYSLKHEQTWESPTIKTISLSSHVCPGFQRKSHNNYANQCKQHFSSLPRHKMQKKKKYNCHSIYYIQLSQASNCTMLLLGPIIQGKIRRVLLILLLLLLLLLFLLSIFVSYQLRCTSYKYMMQFVFHLRSVLCRTSLIFYPINGSTVSLFNRSRPKRHI